MKKDAVSVVERTHPDLLMSPHILDRLIEVTIGDWKPNVSELEQLTTHLTECSSCRRGLIILLSPKKEYGKSSDDTEVIHNLLTRFVTIHREAEAQSEKQMAAYAEAIVAEGKEVADKQFPVLAEHIKRCPDCKSTLEDIIAFLNEEGID